VFFWVVALGIAFYLVRGYFREHPEVLRAILSFAPLRWLRRLWMALRRRFRIVGMAIRERLPRRGDGASAGAAKGLVGDSRARWRSSRGRVLYYYLNVLQRAAKVGFHRRASQTPDEFSVVLERNLLEADEDMAFLTEAFDEARYSRHPIEPALVRRVRAGWRRIRRDLQIVAHPTRTQYARRRPVAPEAPHSDAPQTHSDAPDAPQAPSDRSSDQQQT
jgi:hypothetical protein